MSDTRHPAHKPLEPLATARFYPPKHSFVWHFSRAVVSAARALRSAVILRWIVHCESEPLLVTTRPAVVFAPHQDDETFGCGGLIALKRRAGADVDIVYLTDGGASHKGLAPDAHFALVALRKREALAAAQALGVEELANHFLGYPDGEIARLADDQWDAIVTRVTSLLQELQPAEVFLVHRHDRLADHEACARLILAAIRKAAPRAEVFEYPIWRWWLFGAPTARRRERGDAVLRLAISSVLPQKRRAVAAYPSQLDLLPPGFVRRFLQPFEIYFRAQD